MLKIAIPNKGSLADSSIEILKEAGYRQRSDSRDLVLVDTENNVEFYYLRPRDIALYVGSGELEAGVTGRDLLIDSGAAATEVLALGFGGSTFRFAGPAAQKLSISDLNGRELLLLIQA
jgi:ATP phosphoribosyltransferase